MRDRDEVMSMMEKVLGMATSPEVVVEYSEEHQTATRFGNNAITQNCSGGNATLRMQASDGSRHGSSSTNRLDEQGLEELAARAEEVAADSPVDPEYMPPLAQMSYPDVPNGYFRQTAEAGPERLADSIAGCVSTADSAGMEAAGTFEIGSYTGAMATSNGLRAWDAGTDAEFGITISTGKGSGKASAHSENIDSIDAAALTSEAIETARRNCDHVTLEPGDYTVIMTPYAVWDMLEFLFWDLDAREADEGVNVFAGKTGEKLFDERVRIISPIDDAELPPPVYGDAGLPVRETIWIDGGIVKRLNHTRFWAKEKNTEPDPQMFPVSMEGEDRSFDELIKMCEKGLLINRIWYIRYVDQKELVLTGMTRDGLFLVENGEVKGAVRNFRFNESPITFLSNIIAMSRPERASGGTKMPGIMSCNFTMSSVTEF